MFEEAPLEGIKEVYLTESVLNKIQLQISLVAKLAKVESDALLQKELWAMQLVLNSIDSNIYFDDIDAIPFAENELMLTQSEKYQLAYDFVFGADYANSKVVIANNIKHFCDMLEEHQAYRLNDAVDKMEQAILYQMISQAAFVAWFIVLLILIYFKLIRPAVRYNKILSLGDKRNGQYLLQPIGSSEMQIGRAHV